MLVIKDDIKALPLDHRCLRHSIKEAANCIEKEGESLLIDFYTRAPLMPQNSRSIAEKSIGVTESKSW